VSSVRLSAASFFPLRYEKAVWLPAALLTGGFFMLEELLHGPRVPSLALPATAGPLWDAIYKGGYAFYLLPLALPALRLEKGELRRLLSGFALLLLLGGLAALGPETVRRLDLVPCLQAAAALFTLLAVRRARSLPASTLAAAVLALVAASTFLTQRHDALDIVIGLAAGGLSYKTVYSQNFDFLRHEDLGQEVGRELGELRNLLGSNRRETWEEAYAQGHWDFLNETNQRPRHYVIAGIIQDAFPQGANVLDVGCGMGTLLPLLGSGAAAYTGLDLSQEAVNRCRRTFRESSDRRFLAGSFEEFRPAETFDAVVLNEVLYYFPLRAADRIFRQALALLNKDGVLIVSMNRNMKAALIWRRLSALTRPEQSIRVTNLKTGSYWTVNAYRRKES
jgi:hypothetical protein